MLYRLEMLVDDIKIGLGKEMMDIRDTSPERVLNRDHGQVGSPLFYRRECVLERFTRDRFQLGESRLASEIAVGTGDALERNRPGGSPYVLFPGRGGYYFVHCNALLVSIDSRERHYTLTRRRRGCSTLMRLNPAKQPNYGF